MPEAKSVQVREFRENLAEFLRDAERGTEIVIMSRSKPVARLGPPAVTGRRPLGLMRGRIKMAPDFDVTPPDLIAALEGDEET